MPFTPLSAVKQRLAVGEPLPFHVRDGERALLLARGQVVRSTEQLQALVERGALVDLDDLQSPRDVARYAPREALPRLWNDGLNRVHKALTRLGEGSFTQAMDDASDAVLGLVERDPNLAIFQVLTRDASPEVAYGARRSMHAAITSWLVAHRLAWDAADMERAFKVALTMNLSMLELQGELALQKTPPTPEQRADLLTHPMRSVELLLHAGIDDDDWLQAVARHHEQEDGSGYPTGRSDVGELASLVRRADEYTAKLASRAHREALSADQAGRQMFMRDPGHPMTAALVKEFGIYPPGAWVRLVNGATGVVVERGPTVTTPIVACLHTPKGAPMDAPLRVDTSIGRFAIQCVVGPGSLPQAITLDKLLTQD
jgi:HD-GYP domain-containing protein (c-di-GMP phosphodiesterase class II)